jgi:HAD-hyrolase-like
MKAPNYEAAWVPGLDPGVDPDTCLALGLRWLEDAESRHDAPGVVVLHAKRMIRNTPLLAQAATRWDFVSPRSHRLRDRGPALAIWPPNDRVLELAEDLAYGRLTSSAPTDCRSTRILWPPRWPSGISGRPSCTRKWWRQASSRRGPASRGLFATPRTLVGSWRSPLRRPSRRCAPSWSLPWARIVPPGSISSWPETSSSTRNRLRTSTSSPSRKLGADPADVLVIEDSRNGLEAAHAAGLRCVVTVNGYTEKEDFSEASLVVSSLGEPEGEQTRVLANRSTARPGRWVTLADLEACLAS